jgi:hypothetical protein
MIRPLEAPIMIWSIQKLLSSEVWLRPILGVDTSMPLMSLLHGTVRNHDWPLTRLWFCYRFYLEERGLAARNDQRANGCSATAGIRGVRLRIVKPSWLQASIVSKVCASLDPDWAIGSR